MDSVSPSKDDLVQDPLCLSNQICFTIYSAINAIRKVYRPLLEDIGVTYSQYLTMLVLWQTDFLTISEIGRRLRLDPATMTPLLRRLESKGLVRRNKRLNDQREVIVSLTLAGLDLREKAAHVRCEVEKRLRMSQNNIVSLRGDLGMLISGLADSDNAAASAMQPPK